MTRRNRTRTWALSIAMGCAGPQPEATTNTATPTERTTPELAPRGPDAPAPAPAPAPAATTVLVAPPLLGRDHHSVVACTSDADCGWDDACRPTRCVEPTAKQSCDESVPPPGHCGCIDGACTTKPTTAPAPSGTCEVRGCVLDRAAGRCVADTGGVPEGLRATPGLDAGPSCDCIDPAKGCTFTWFEPVPCHDDRDCWLDPSPRLHPVARPKALRKRDFVPCKDGEVAPRCGPAGSCILGPAYSC